MPRGSPADPQALLPLRAVEVFAAVGRRGTVTAAAEELGVTPGACTQQIRLLEQYLAVRLLQRSGRGVELTRWGKLFLPHAVRAMDEVRNGCREMKAARSSIDITISSYPSVMNCWLGPLLLEWHKRYPASNIRVESSDVEPTLEGDGVDFRISYGPRCRTHQRFKELFTDYVFPVASPTLLSHMRRIERPEDLLGAPLLCVDWGLDYEYGSENSGPPGWKEWFAASGLEAQQEPCALTYSLSSAALDAACTGRGVVLAQHSLIERELADGRLVRVLEHTLPMGKPYYIAWNRSALDKPLGTTFLTWLTEAGRRLEWKAGGHRNT